MIRLLPILLVLASCGEGHRVNPGASVAVYEHTGYGYLGEGVAGDFDPAWPQTIHVSGYISRGDAQFAHELIHFLEARLNAQGDHIGVRIVHNAFRDICCPDFELGHDDLMTRETQ